MTRKELISTIKKRKSFLCVGLDPDINKMPLHIAEGQDPLYNFCQKIVDATAGYCVAYKPNSAFFECYGVEGWSALTRIVAYIKENYPEHLVIVDAKRGDIGNTSAMYARAFFEDMRADALTVAPYMGEDSVTPFLQYENKWVVLLDLTSNRGSFDFQHLETADGTPLWKHVLQISGTWQGADHLMYVVGATQAEMLQRIREVVPDKFLLVPGVGAQGGSLEDVCKYGMTSDCGLIVNSSRGIIYASKGSDFAEAAAREAQKLQQMMQKELEGIL